MNICSEHFDDSAPASAAAVEERLLSHMRQRADQIAERSERRRNDLPSRYAETESADAFLAQFSEMKAKLEAGLLACDDISKNMDGKDECDAKELHKQFDDLVREHSLLQQFLNESSMFLAAFQVKRSQEILSELSAQIQNKMETALPKKRFGFRNKTPAGKPNASDVSKTQEKIVCRDVTDSNCNRQDVLDKILQSNFFGFKDRCNERLVMEAAQIQNRQLNLQNLENCTVVVLGNPSTVQISSLKKCTVILGPVSRSVFVKNCVGGSLAIACQQLRIHNTTDSEFYLHVTGAAIIESCEGVGFAPYSLDYPDLERHYELSGLDRKVNNWDSVDDFKWLNKEEKSPHMFIIAENDRKYDWL